MALGRVPRLRILTALLGTLVIVSILPLVLSNLALVNVNRGALQTGESKYLSRSAVTLAENTATYLRNSETQLRKIADALRLASSVAPSRNAFQYAGESGFLSEFVEADVNLLVLRALPAEGLGGVAQQLPSDVPLGENLEAELSRARAAALRGEIYQSEALKPQVFPDGGLVMGVPVTAGAGAAATGAVVAFLSLTPVKGWLEDEAKRGGVFTYVVDRRGRLILSSDPASVPPPDQLRRVELVSEFITNPGRMTTSYTRGEGKLARSILGTLAPVESVDWGVIVEKDEASVFASVKQMTVYATLAVVLALVFSTIVALFAARALSRPVVELAGKVRLIADGNYKQRVEVRGATEIAALAESFNAMTDSLESSIQKLKQAAKENQELFLNSIRTLAAAIDAKDPYTRGHSERVARYAVAIAKHMDISLEDVRRVRISALLHDVGKIGIDDRILRKPTALTDEEFQVMKTHPVTGALIIGQIKQLRDIIPGIKHHHEKWEGGGYPDGLVGEDIPMLARIVTVADTFDAMTTTRPYQKAMPLDYVTSRITSFSGTRFDPKVIDAFRKAHEAHDIEVVGEAARVAMAASA
ncbi:MAG: HD domain-containing protein [Acidobacteria bacterium]|nr:HD domain-containing protein [Acidobacteriota bacterium]